MNRKSIRTIVVPLSYHHLASGSLAKLACPGCRVPLDAHQPNQEQPDQFLGICPKCGRWFRVVASDAEDGLAVLELPELADLAPRLDARKGQA